MGKSRREVNMAWNRQWITTPRYRQLWAAVKAKNNATDQKGFRWKQYTNIDIKN
jgi:hypothetical protein